MNPDFPFVPGDKIRGDKIRGHRWAPNSFVTVVDLGTTHFVYADGRGVHVMRKDDVSDWERYIEPPVRKRWIVETEEKPARRGEIVIGVAVSDWTTRQVFVHDGESSTHYDGVIVSVRPAE